MGHSSSAFPWLSILKTSKWEVCAATTSKEYLPGVMSHLLASLDPEVAPGLSCTSAHFKHGFSLRSGLLLEE